MKVWLVFRGAYSDRGTVAVFSTAEKAAAYVAPLESVVAEHVYGDSYDIEEWTVDGAAVPPPVTFYGGVTLYERTGWTPDHASPPSEPWSFDADHLNVGISTDEIRREVGVRVQECDHGSLGPWVTISSRQSSPELVRRTMADKVAEVRAEKLGLT